MRSAARGRMNLEGGVSCGSDEKRGGEGMGVGGAYAADPDEVGEEGCGGEVEERDAIGEIEERERDDVGEVVGGGEEEVALE